MSRMARATTSARTFHSGDPGVASGRQRLHARKPACWAAAAPGPGHVVVDVHACAVNFPDVLVIQNLYQLKPPLPFSPGTEVAGTVSAIGEGVTGVEVGDRVLASPGWGGLAEKVAVPSR